MKMISRWNSSWSDKRSRQTLLQKTKTHVLCSVTFFFSENPAVYGNVEKCIRASQATDDNIIRRMGFACWITKATNTHSKYVILTAIPLQHSLRERAWHLRCTYIACLVGTWPRCTSAFVGCGTNVFSSIGYSKFVYTIDKVIHKWGHVTQKAFILGVMTLAIPVKG